MEYRREKGGGGRAAGAMKNWRPCSKNMEGIIKKLAETVAEPLQKMLALGSMNFILALPPETK